MFTKNTTRAEIQNWLLSCGCYAGEVKFIINQLSSGENKVAGEITVANNLYALTSANKWNVIRQEAIELGYKG